MKSYTKAYIPYGGYYSTPSAVGRGVCSTTTQSRWSQYRQKMVSGEENRSHDCRLPLFWTTVAQHHWFYAHQWSGAILTDDKKYVPGLFIHQACSTSTTILKPLRVEFGGGGLRGGLWPDERPLFKRAPHHVGRSFGSGRPARQGRLEYGQLRWKSPRARRHGGDRRERGQGSRHHQGGVRRFGPEAL